MVDESELGISSFLKLFLIFGAGEKEDQERKAKKAEKQKLKAEKQKIKVENSMKVLQNSRNPNLMCRGCW